MEKQPRIKKCPACGGDAGATLEVVEGWALLDVDAHGQLQYSGSTEIEWNSQVTKTTKRGRKEVITLQCSECRREWESELEK